ncbi:MAG: M48 family metallopeptidase [Patescibacteria group bacterium]
MNLTTSHNHQIQIIFKKIKSINLRIDQNTREIWLSAPYNVNKDYLLKFIESKALWISKCLEIIAQKQVVKSQLREDEYLLRGSILNIDQSKSTDNPKKLDQSKIKQKIEKIQRKELKKSLDDMVPVWEKKLNVKTTKVRIVKMRTRWGSCNTRTGSININLKLIEKDPRLLEYIVIHELIHLIEPSHNSRFKHYMDIHSPNWRELKKELNYS